MNALPGDLRRNNRVKTSVSCIFGATVEATRSGTVTSLSVAGCFVKTTAYSNKGQIMHVRLWLPQGRWLPLRGEVIYQMEGIGFGLVFAGLGDEERDALVALLDHGQ
jgi:hypothetical protein